MRTSLDERDSLITAARAAAPAVAEALAKLDPSGLPWRLDGDAVDMDGRPTWYFTLQRSDDLGVSVSVDSHEKRVRFAAARLARPPVLAASGNRDVFSDFFADHLRRDNPAYRVESTMAAERFSTGKPAVTAALIWRTVASHLAAEYPRIAAAMAECVARIAQRDALAARLAQRFGYTVREPGDGFRGDGKVTLYKPGPLPALEVSAWGNLTTAHALPLTEHTATALLSAILSEPAKEG